MVSLQKDIKSVTIVEFTYGLEIIDYIHFISYGSACLTKKCFHHKAKTILPLSTKHLRQDTFDDTQH